LSEKRVLYQQVDRKITELWGSHCSFYDNDCVQDPEDGGSGFFIDLGNEVPDDTALHPKDNNLQ